MTGGVSSISTPLLVEFLVAVSSATDEPQAARVAAERASHSLEAEVGAVLFDGSLAAVLGFPAGKVPERELCEAAAGGRTVLYVPGAGDCHVVVAHIAGTPDGQMLLARSGEDAFTVEEVHLVRAMARMLELTLAKMHMLEQERSLRVSLQERQRMLEQLSAIQRAIARREPLAQILHMVTASAQELFGGGVRVALHLLATDDDHRGDAGLACGADLPEAPTQPVGRVSLRSPSLAEPAGEPHGAISVPVHEDGRLAGHLTVTPTACDGSCATLDVDTLRAFADQVSLAITDARTRQQMQEAFHDSVTGLASRRLFLERVACGLSDARSSGGRIAVLFIDLDRFKLVNDTLGHAAGDDLLVQVAHRLREEIRSCDVAARLGGDEFAVLLTDVTSTELPEVVARRILDAVSRVFDVAGRDVFIDASIGIALGAPDVNDAEGVIGDADLAMYVAKQNGRGRHQLFHEELAAPLRRRVQLDADLHRALENDELLLHYQPILKLSDGNVAGVEALMRWQHPDRGLIPPLEFLPVAEETGLIVPIGRCILREACQQAARWQTARPAWPPLFVSVNLSCRQLQDGQLLQDVTAALDASGLSPELLKLEIAEASLQHDSETAVTNLERLRDYGVRIAMHHFGTGSSSLTSLRRLPIDLLKLDSSLVAEIETEVGAAAFAGSVVSLAQSLGLLTIAHGIESQAQLTTLRDAGCELAQGYHIAPPLDANSVFKVVTAVGPGQALHTGVQSRRGPTRRRTVQQVA
jgi:diguanylate cyclase (GGDEF)-like protein